MRRALARQGIEATHLREVVIRDYDDRASRVKATAAGAPSHLRVLSGHDVPKAAPVVLPDVGKNDTFGRHVHALQSG